MAALLVAAVLPGVASAAPCGRDAAERSGRWFAAKPPLPPHGLVYRAQYGSAQRVRAAAIDPGDRRVVLVTDGTRVQRSDDGGCTWREVWTIGDRDATTEITAIDVARVGGRTRVLLALVTELKWTIVAKPVQVEVVRSDDGRTGWTTAYDTVGLLTIEHSHPVVHLRSGAGGSAYVVVPTLAGTVGYAFSADGRAWEARTPSASVDGPVELEGFAVSPWDPNEVWDWGSAREGDSGVRLLRRSKDGARTWQRVDPWPMYQEDPVWRLADVVWPRRGAPARVAVAGGSTTSSTSALDLRAAVAWSGDGGATFGLSIPPPGMRLSIHEGPLAHTPRGDLVVAGRDGRVLQVPYGRRLPRPEEWRRLSPLPKPNGIEFLQFGYDAGRASATSPTTVLIPRWEGVYLLRVG